MKRNKDWTDVMRSELREAETTPPDGGWERLRREMAAFDANATVGKASRPHVLRLWPRLVAAAAAVLLCVVATEVLRHTALTPAVEGSVVATTGGDTQISLSETAGEQASEPLLAAAANPIGNDSGENRGISGQPKAAKPNGLQPSSERIARANRRQPKLLTENASYRDHPSERPIPEGKAADGTIAPIKDAGSSLAENSSAQDADGERPLEGDCADERTSTDTRSGLPPRITVVSQPNERFVAYAPPRRKTSFGLFAGGGVTGGGKVGMPSGGMLINDVLSSSDGQVTALKRPDDAKESYNHHQPIGFGLSVRKEFSHGLSLESGVNYTLLRSDIRLRYASEDIGQQLHFIGIPLRMNWRFLQRGGFSLYIGAGGMVEKCISAKQGSRSVAEKRLQWSAHGVAGAEYRFAGLVGLYFEPEASYYFTATSLPTARTDTPLTLTLRLGVRFSF